MAKAFYFTYPPGLDWQWVWTKMEHYEAAHEPIEPPDLIEALIYHMERRGLKRRDLTPCLGSRARIAEVLNRKRLLSIEMIRNLHAALGISPDVLIRPYLVKGSAA
jgi:HTH-type transcriptional regulator/antitoxin HigA